MKKEVISTKVKLVGIKAKMIVLLTVIGIIPLILSGMYISISMSNVIKQNYEVSTNATLSEISKGLDNYFEGLENIVEMMSNNKNVIEYKDNKENDYIWLEDYFKGIHDVQDEVISVYVGTQDRTMVSYPKDDYTNYNPTERPWYTAALENPGEVVYSDPYTDFNDENLHLISLSKTFNINGKIAGVVAIDIDLSKFSQGVNDVKLGETGYLFVTSNKGEILAHPTAKYIGQSLNDEAHSQIINNKNKDFLLTKENKVNKYLTYTTNSSTGWKICAMIDEVEILQSIKYINKINVISILIMTLIVIAIAIFVGRYVSKFITSLKDVIQNASMGDLTKQANITTNDEFGELSTHFNSMTKNISNLVRNSRTTSLSVAKSAEEVTEINKEIVSSTEEMAHAIEEIAKGATDQALSAQNGANAMNELSGIIENISQIVDDIYDLSEKTNTLGVAGFRVMENLNEKNQQTKSDFLSLSEAIKVIDENTQSITTITDVITKITDQTNLLSLNASIEAARAGDAGKGFSVVAQEIRNLSEQSKNSTQDIENVVKAIRGSVDTVVLSLNKSSNILNEQNSIVKATETTFVNINDSVKQLTNKIIEMKSLAENMNEKNAIVVENIDDISAVSQETAATTEELSASAEEINATIEDLLTHMTNLKELSEELHSNINHFKLTDIIEDK